VAKPVSVAALTTGTAAVARPRQCSANRTRLPGTGSRWPARLATDVNALDPVAAACDAVVDVKSCA
jgi:hypothetical protein